jgi:hypothetical protein
MNRICIYQDENGGITGIVADEPLEIFFVAKHQPQDRVYQFESALFGPNHVRDAIGGYPVGHMSDGTFAELGDGTGKRPPSIPAIEPVT